MSDAFDADVLIFAVNDNPLGEAIRDALAAADPIGSVMLLPEVLSKPLRRGDAVEYDELTRLLARFELKNVDAEIADAATTLAAKYGLKAADAIHLATAVVWGAQRFHTNNRKDFGPHIEEVEVVWPAVAAIRLPRDREFTDSYAAASDEWDASGDSVVWDSTASDGLR